MNKKLVEVIENSDIDSDIKMFLIESLLIEETGDVRYKKRYEKLVENFVGDKL